MSAPFVFNVRQVDDVDGPELYATTDDGRLRGVVFVWRGGRLVDYMLSGHDAVDCVAVPYDWRAGVVLLPFTPAALAAYLADYFDDIHNLAACRDTLAHQ
jgi:hypothetical protein